MTSEKSSIMITILDKETAILDEALAEFTIVLLSPISSVLDNLPATNCYMHIPVQSR